MDNSLDTLLVKYQAEIVEDIKLDELSLKDRAMMVPTIKHKWVARMMVHKDQIRKLEAKRKVLIKNLNNNSPIALTKQSMEVLASNNPEVAIVQTAIEQLEVIIEYLEKVEKLVSSLTFDCKNVIDLQKLETT